LHQAYCVPPLYSCVPIAMLYLSYRIYLFFFFQAEDGIRDFHVTGVQTCALPIFCSRNVSSNSPLLIIAISCLYGAFLLFLSSPTKGVSKIFGTLSNCGWLMIYDNALKPI